MKSLLLFLAYIFILALQTHAQNRPDREFDNLIGPVHNVRVERAVIKCESGECVEGQRVRSTFDSYDVQGNEVERTDYEKDGSITNVVLFEYEVDKTGNWVKKKMTIKRPNDGQMNVGAIAVYYRTITYH